MATANGRLACVEQESQAVVCDLLSSLDYSPSFCVSGWMGATDSALIHSLGCLASVSVERSLVRQFVYQPAQGRTPSRRDIFLIDSLMKIADPGIQKDSVYLVFERYTLIA